MGILIHQLPEFSREQEASAFWSSISGETLILKSPATVKTCPRLSLRASFGDRLSYRVGESAPVDVDSDGYLLLNPGTACEFLGHKSSTGLNSGSAFTIYFSEKSVRRALAEFNGYSFNGPLSSAHGPALVHEYIRAQDDRVAPVLREFTRLVDGVSSTSRSQTMVDVQAQTEAVLAAILLNRHFEKEQISALPQVRARTREQIFTRVHTATSYLLAHYDSPLTLDKLADVACLAKFHFLRMFTLVHHMTPMEYLRCKRVAVASRLLARDGLSLAQVAKQVGVADRSTLLRLFLDYRNMTPDQYRRSLGQNSARWPKDTLFADLLANRVASRQGHGAVQDSVKSSVQTADTALA